MTQQKKVIIIGSGWVDCPVGLSLQRMVMTLLYLNRAFRWVVVCNVSPAVVQSSRQECTS